MEDNSDARVLAGESGDRRISLFYGLAVGVFVFVAAALIHSFVLADPDTLWHVKVGLDILSRHALPRTDIYSFTFFGHPWIAKEWLGQIVLALFYLADGWNGVTLGTAFVYAVSAFMVFVSLARAIRPVLAAGATIGIMVLVSTTLLARPHLISFPFLIIWTDQLFLRARMRRGPPFWALAVLAVWANIHAGFTLGFVIALFAFLDVAERTGFKDRGLLARWVVFGALCPLVSIIHPYGVQSILATFTIALGNDAVPFINEWVPLSMANKPVHVVAIVLLAAVLLVRPLRTTASRAAFSGLMLFMFLSHVRFVYAFFLLVPIALAFDIAKDNPAISRQQWLAAKRDGFETFLRASGRGVLMALGGLGIAFAAVFALIPGIAPPQSASAAGAIEYARAHGLEGHVLNSYDFGGALIFNGIATFVDGRTDQLFLGGFWKDLRASKGRDGGAALNGLLAKYDISWALLTRSDPRVTLFGQMGGWTRAYEDASAVIFTKRSGG